MKSGNPRLPDLEIERRFLVTDVKTALRDATSCTHMRQGYLAIDNHAKSAVRIRQFGKTCVMTVKSGTGIAKHEEEITLLGEVFDRLWMIARGSSLEKKRYSVPYGGHYMEVDVFEGTLSGLIIAEVEFDTVDEADAFMPPAWIEREITTDHQYSNAWMARNGNPLHLQGPAA